MDKDDRYLAMTWGGPKQIPVSVGILPAAWIRYREDLDAIVARHPALFGHVEPGQRDYDAVGGTYTRGTHVDAWGCVWSNVHHGAESIVTGHPVPTRADVWKLEPPAAGAGLPHGFMWLRLADLRGFEELMCDFGDEAPELARLIEVVLAYNLGEVARLTTATDHWMMYFGDDLGLQTALPISPTQWRRWLKPCYQAIYAVPRAAGRRIYMHTDGHLLPIVDDLIDCGVDVLNPQVRANGLAGLREQCFAKVCVDLDLDRQLFPFCTPADIDDHVHECVDRLGSPAGGLWLKAEIGDDVPLANVEAIFSALEKYREL